MQRHRKPEARYRIPERQREALSRLDNDLPVRWSTLLTLEQAGLVAPARNKSAAMTAMGTRALKTGWAVRSGGTKR